MKWLTSLIGMMLSAALVLVLGHLIAWNGQSLSDRARPMSRWIASEWREWSPTVQGWFGFPNHPTTRRFGLEEKTAGPSQADQPDREALRSVLERE